MMDECHHILICACVPMLAGKHAYHILLAISLMQVGFGLGHRSKLLLELIALDLDLKVLAPG
jgi:hypothetical protein